MTLQAKLGIAALTIGSGGVATYAALVPKVRGTEISKLINEKFRHILLDTKDETDNGEWDKKWSSYYKANKDSKKDIFNLEGWTKGEDKKLKDKLRKKCEALAKEEVQKTTDDLYKNVTTYCSRNVTIKDHAEKEKLDLIKSDGDATAIWDKVAKKHEKFKSDFDNLNIKAPSGKSSTITGAQVKTGCEEAVKKHKGEDKYDEIYNSYKKVCVKEATKDES